MFRRRMAAVALLALTAGCQQAVAERPRSLAPIDSSFVPPAWDRFTRRPVVKPAYAVAAAKPRLTLFDGTRVVLPAHRVVAFYGAAGAPTLGVLGTGSPDAVWPRLARQARSYRTDKTAVLPAYELIAFVATRSRGNQGNYSSRVPDSTIARYARAAKRHHALLILDVQPGRGQFLDDARSLSRWLRLPYVGLGLDPEWKLYGGQLPLSRIGHTYGSTVNRVSRWLDRMTRTRGLPQKLLLVHQFTADMVRDKAAVLPRRHLAVVFNVDGFGSRAAKLGKYRDFASDRRFPLGFKLFYDWDIGLLSPGEVLRMHPRPAVVEYE